MKPHLFPWTWFVAIALSCGLGANIASANIVITGVTAGSTIAGIDTEEAISNSKVTTNTIGYDAGASQAMKNALAGQLPAWTFNYAAGLGGTLNINPYVPTSTRDDNGGGKIDATYTRANGDPVLANLHWIQLVTTNSPLNGGPTTGYIDPLPNDDKLPFYWTVPGGTTGRQRRQAKQRHHLSFLRQLAADPLIPMRPRSTGPVTCCLPPGPTPGSNSANQHPARGKSDCDHLRWYPMGLDLYRCSRAGQSGRPAGRSRRLWDLAGSIEA